MRIAAGALVAAPATGMSATRPGHLAATPASSRRARRAVSSVAANGTPPALQRRLLRERRTRLVAWTAQVPQARPQPRHRRSRRQCRSLLLRRGRLRIRLPPPRRSGYRSRHRRTPRLGQRPARRAPTPRRALWPARRSARARTRMCGIRRQPPRRAAPVRQPSRRRCRRRRGSLPSRRHPQPPASAPRPCRRRRRATRPRSPRRAT